jgi:4-hydroxy-tetrahydrodipicolinate synthase
VIDMTNDTMCKLAELPRIVGVKDATGDLGRPLLIRNRLGDDFCQLSGKDDTATAFLAQGGHGCISVTSNIAPAQCAKMHDAWQAGDLGAMIDMRDLLAPIHKALFCETSPAPVKYAASLLGFGTDEVRLPLVPASKAARSAVDDAMLSAKLVSGDKGATLRAHG